MKIKEKHSAMFYMTSFFNADQLVPSVILCSTSIVSIITGSEYFSL